MLKLVDYRLNNLENDLKDLRKFPDQLYNVKDIVSKEKPLKPQVVTEYVEAAIPEPEFIPEPEYYPEPAEILIPEPAPPIAVPEPPIAISPAPFQLPEFVVDYPIPQQVPFANEFVEEEMYETPFGSEYVEEDVYQTPFGPQFFGESVEEDFYGPNVFANPYPIYQPAMPGPPPAEFVEPLEESMPTSFVDIMPYTDGKAFVQNVPQPIAEPVLTSPWPLVTPTE